jgi:hypothetical protein
MNRAIYASVALSQHVQDLNGARRDLDTIRALLNRGRVVAALDVVVDAVRRIDGEIVRARRGEAS